MEATGGEEAPERRRLVNQSLCAICAHIAPTSSIRAWMLRHAVRLRVATGIPEGTGPSKMSRANHSSSMKTLRTVGAAARGARPRPPRGTDDRPRPDDGRAARGPPLADRACARAVRSGGRLAVRQPGAVQRALRPRALPAPGAARRRAGGAGRRRSAVRALGRGGLPAGLRDERRGARRQRAAGGRRARRGALPRRQHGRHEAALHVPARTSPTSARRTPSRSS